MALVRANKRPEAVPYLERALGQMPDDVYVMDQLVQAYETANNAEKAGAMRRRLEKTRSTLSERTGTEAK